METAGVFHEKGVDVKIAVDLLVGAYDNLYDVAILISSDSDLVPVIKKVKQLGKKLGYVGFKHRPSFALKRDASFFRFLELSDINKFIKND